MKSWNSQVNVWSEEKNHSEQRISNPEWQVHINNYADVNF